MATTNYRTANVDIYDPESSVNFPLSTLLPSSLPPPTSAAQAATTAQQIRHQLRAGDSAAALASVLDSAPLGGDEGAKQVHLTTVIEVLQGIRQSEVVRVLDVVLGNNGAGRSSAGGRGRERERGDTLMKYLYRGMGAPGGVSPQVTGTGSGSGSGSGTGGGFSQIQARNLGEAAPGGGQAMSVLLSWHEKLVEILGVGGIVRVMCDRRTV